MVVNDLSIYFCSFIGCSTAQFHMVVKAEQLAYMLWLCCSTAQFHMVVKESYPLFLVFFSREQLK